MLRVLNFTLPAYPSPEGSGHYSVNPLFDWENKPPIHIENESKERPISDILGEYQTRNFLLGPFRGEIFAIGGLSTKPHTTYASYFNPNTKSKWDAKYIAELNPEKFIGKFKMIEVIAKERDIISLEQIEDMNLEKDDIVIIKTGYSKNRKKEPTKDYYLNSPGLSIDAAKWLAKKEVKAVVSDVRNLEPIDNKHKESVHQILNTAEILVVEDVTNLDNISTKQDYLAIGIPIQIFGASGGPARVIAFELGNPENFTDLSHMLDFYPEKRLNYDLPFETPLPKRIEPRDLQAIIVAWTKLTPFLLKGDSVREPDHESIEMFMQFSHGTHTHAESALFDAFGEHNISKETLKKYVRMPVERLVGNASLLDITNDIGPRQTITLDVVKQAGADIRKGDILFVKTEMNDWYMHGKAIEITPGFSIEAARWLIDQGIKAIVIDFPSVEMSNPFSGIPGIRYTSNIIHYEFHRNDIPVVERVIKLRLLKKKRFKSIILPLQASHLGGFPVHVLAFEEWN